MPGSAMLGESMLGWDESEFEDVELAVQFVHGTDLPDGYTTTGGGVPGTPYTAGTPSGLRRLARQVDASIKATVALVTVKDEAPFPVTHPDVVHGRYEIALDFGDASRRSGAWWARRYLDEVSNARRGIQIELMPGVGPQPYRDFDLGDSVRVLGERHRVVGIGWSVDASSVVQWTVDLDQPRMLLEERLGSIMRRQLPGSLGGRTVLPSRVEPQFVSQRSADEKTETWSANADPGVVVFRKNGVAITGATATVGVGDTEPVTLVDPERRYDLKVDKHDFTIDGVSGFPELVLPDGRWIQALQITGSANGVSIAVQYR